MGVSEVISLLQIVVANLPGAITTTTQIVDLGTKFYASVNGEQPTPAEIAELRAAVDSDVAKALEPLPAPQPGDPDYVP